MIRSGRQGAAPAACGLLIAVVCGSAGCSPAGPHDSGAEELETVEVSPPPDARVEPEHDPQEVRAPREVLAGRLPSDFPASLPVFGGSSIVDLAAPEEAPYVTFLAPGRRDVVSPAYRRQLGVAGWTLAGGSDPLGPFTARRGGEQARISFREQGPSTEIRVDY